MKALILNSGSGTRMGSLTENLPKCLTKLSETETILSQQLKFLSLASVKEVVITTGKFHQEIQEYCASLGLPLEISFVKNEKYAETNYIYSIYQARHLLKEDILLFHGDLVFEFSVLKRVLEQEQSGVVISSTAELPEKDFKARWIEGRVEEISIELGENQVTAQPFYHLKEAEWSVWLNKIVEFCENGTVHCYAENAFNEVWQDCPIGGIDVKNELCLEIDTQEDLENVVKKWECSKDKTVYMCFSSDMIHSGHISIIQKASLLGRLVVGLLTDEAIAQYKRFPLMPYENRKILFENILGVSEVVQQNELSYRNVLEMLKPDFVVHGDDWKEGIQKPVREEVLEVLQTFDGTLVEFPYENDKTFQEMEKMARQQLSIPDLRRGRLRKLLSMKPLITVMEAHSGITGLIVEQSTVYQDGKTKQFDAMWVSSLCDSTAKGKPDIELVDFSSRMRTIDDIMEVTTKPIILDGDTGGQVEHFVYTVKTLERMGVSAVIIEDKTGLKKNSLFGTEAEQTQDSIENFSAKIMAGKRAQKTKEFMIIARIESLILEKGMDDALLRAKSFVKAGADGIMIHSRQKSPDEIFKFIEKFRNADSVTPVVVVPSSFNSVTEEEFIEKGANIVIYANQLTRSGFPAMQKTAESILTHHRAQEADQAYCMSIKEIITLIPEE
ncbi:MAG: phosphoenolpyruvate mutase [Eubacteriales bacterium]